MKKILLCIMDGFGYREDNYGNAINQANKPNIINLWNTYPHSLLDASGKLVGLPDGQMGNSEVGHTNIGAGRIVYQPLERINQRIQDKSFFQNPQLLEAIENVKAHHSKLHIYGMLSDGGVHSHIDHILALLDLCQQEHMYNVYLHIFTDGRDTKPNVCYQYIEILEAKLKELGFGTIASISGRYYAMDRDKRWDRVKLAYDAIVNAKAPLYHTAKEVIEDNYQNKRYDEFILPSILTTKGNLEEHDSIIFANFRPDRATELLTAISNSQFKNLPVTTYTQVKLVTMMPCVGSVISTPAFQEDPLQNTLGEYLSNLGYTQLRIAETEKYAHVTYFFDGVVEKDLKGCKKILIPSPKDIPTYDLKPEMSAYQVTDALLKEMENNYQLIILNYANCDMVGHTGNMNATIKAVEVVDECIGKIYEQAQKMNYTMMIIADHGNADIMLDQDGNIVTAHTTSKVPCIITDQTYQVKDGKLGDIAPTILAMLEIKIPKEMTGNVIIDKII